MPCRFLSKTLSLMALGILGACASRYEIVELECWPRPPVEGTDYELVIRDNSDAKQFELEVLSLSEQAICIPNGNWPASAPRSSPSSVRRGSLHFKSNRVYVDAIGEQFPIREANFGYCLPDPERPLACTTVVGPHDRLQGVIPYSEFEGDLASIAHVYKRLRFELVSGFCAANRVGGPTYHRVRIKSIELEN